MAVLCNYTRDSSGNLAFTFSPAFTGTIQVGSGNGGGGITYPGAGVPNCTGSAWGTSYTVGTAANNLVQLNGSAQLPGVSGALLELILRVDKSLRLWASRDSAGQTRYQQLTECSGVANTATHTLGTSNQNWATLNRYCQEHNHHLRFLPNAVASDITTALGYTPRSIKLGYGAGSDKRQPHGRDISHVTGKYRSGSGGLKCSHHGRLLCQSSFLLRPPAGTEQ